MTTRVWNLVEIELCIVDMICNGNCQTLYNTIYLQDWPKYNKKKNRLFLFSKTGNTWSFFFTSLTFELHSELDSLFFLLRFA